VPAWIPKRKRWRLLGIFLLLLAASHIWRWYVPAHGNPLPGQFASQVEIVDEDGDPTGQETTIYYRDLRPPGKPDAPVIVLLHGSWATDHDRDALAQALAKDFRVIVPDLPGFGASDGPDLPDYSPPSYAQELDEFLSNLRLERVHLVAFGMGGAIALELADSVPESVQSVNSSGSATPSSTTPFTARNSARSTPRANSSRTSACSTPAPSISPR
jgi:pimeloyl-ACP methyl ester carboxylesterase